MRQLFIKDLKLFLTDKGAIILSIILPMALTTLLAFAFGGVATSTKKTNRTIKLMITDLDNTEWSKYLVKEISKMKEIKLEETDTISAQNLIKTGKGSALLILAKGLADSINAGHKLPLDLQYDAAKEMEIGLLQGALTPKLLELQVKNKNFFLNQIPNTTTMKDLRNNYEKFYNSIEKLSQKDNSNKDSTDTNRISFFNAKNYFKLSPLVKADKKETLGLVQAVVATAIMFLLFMVSSCGLSLIDESESGTLRRLLLAPLSPNSILFSKFLFTIFVAICQLIILLFFAFFVFGLNIFELFPNLILVVVATAYCCASFGLLIASVASTRQQIQGLSSFIILVMSCLGGSMMPLYFMPNFMQKLAVISVNYWGINAFYDVLWRKLPLTNQSFLFHIFILFFIGTILHLISRYFFKKNIFKKM